MTLRKVITLCAAVLGVAILLSLVDRDRSQANARQPSLESESSQQYTAWVGKSLKRMQSVKAGMMRADLLKTFTTEGGLSTGLQRTYVYRECPYFKVDVEFEPVGRPARDAEGRVTLVESDADVIKKISTPYVGWSIAD
jgi:hypothetical protein